MAVQTSNSSAHITCFNLTLDREATYKIVEYASGSVVASGKHEAAGIDRVCAAKNVCYSLDVVPENATGSVGGTELSTGLKDHMLFVIDESDRITRGCDHSSPSAVLATFAPTPSDLIAFKISASIVLFNFTFSSFEASDQEALARAFHDQISVISHHESINVTHVCLLVFEQGQTTETKTPKNIRACGENAIPRSKRRLDEADDDGSSSTGDDDFFTDYDDYFTYGDDQGNDDTGRIVVSFLVENLYAGGTLHADALFDSFNLEYGNVIATGTLEAKIREHGRSLRTKIAHARIEEPTTVANFEVFSIFNFVSLPTSLPTLLHPSALPSPSPTPMPTPLPSPFPTPMPTPLPSQLPIPLPTSLPSRTPSNLPSVEPTATPTNCPSPFPSTTPNPQPSSEPTILPTEFPSLEPSPPPTQVPSPAPTSESPSASPTSRDALAIISSGFVLGGFNASQFGDTERLIIRNVLVDIINVVVNQKQVKNIQAVDRLRRKLSGSRRILAVSDEVDITFDIELASAGPDQALLLADQIRGDLTSAIQIDDDNGTSLLESSIVLEAESIGIATTLTLAVVNEYASLFEIENTLVVVVTDSPTSFTPHPTAVPTTFPTHMPTPLPSQMPSTLMPTVSPSKSPYARPSAPPPTDPPSLLPTFADVPTTILSGFVLAGITSSAFGDTEKEIVKDVLVDVISVIVDESQVKNVQGTDRVLNRRRLAASDLEEIDVSFEIEVVSAGSDQASSLANRVQQELTESVDVADDDFSVSVLETSIYYAALSGGQNVLTNISVNENASLAIIASTTLVVETESPTPTLNFEPIAFPTSSDAPMTTMPSNMPTTKETTSPTRHPIFEKTLPPTQTPTMCPSQGPTDVKSESPSRQPAGTPSECPSNEPSHRPTDKVSPNPSKNPTEQPSYGPTARPTREPTQRPVEAQSPRPMYEPSQRPSEEPSPRPTYAPSQRAVVEPSPRPSSEPRLRPSDEVIPRSSPAPSERPHAMPSLRPTREPIPQPSENPIFTPTHEPSPRPSKAPNFKPTHEPSHPPTDEPIPKPTHEPTRSSSEEPSTRPILAPTKTPTPEPITVPSASPILTPTLRSSHTPTHLQMSKPSFVPTVLGPTQLIAPTRFPSQFLSFSPTSCQNVEFAPPPYLKDAYFTSTAARVVIALSTDSDQAGKAAGESFQCSEIFEFDDSSLASCYFINQTTVNVDISTAVSFLPQGIITLRAGALKSNCPFSSPTPRCDCIPFANASSIAAREPDDAVIPEVVFQGPSTTSTCKDVVISADQSTGGAGRAMSYAWTAEMDDVESEDVVRSALVDSQGQSELRFNSTELERLISFGNELAIHLNLTNFLGHTGTGDFTLSLVSDQIPSLLIVGNRQRRMKRSEELVVAAQGFATDCDERLDRDRQVTFEWELYDESSSVPHSSVANNPAVFKLHPFTLSTGSTYSLRVTVRDPLIPTLNNTAIVMISIVPGSVIAAIEGGDQRSSSVAKPLTLSATNSRDEDIPSGDNKDSDLTFLWTCETRIAEPCNISTEVFDAVELFIPANTFSRGGKFIFTVTVVARDGERSSTATSVVDFVEFSDGDAEMPIVAVGSFGTPVRNLDKITLAGGVSVPGGMVSRTLSSHWEVTSGELADGIGLSSASRTPLNISSFNSSLPSRSHDLVLRPSTLVAGGTYAFTLTAQFDGRRGYATSIVNVYSPPTSGTLEVSPPSGIAFFDLFSLRALSWAGEAPLYYRFLSERGILRASTTDPTVHDVRLPLSMSGTETTAVTVVVTDIFGAESSVNVDVTIEQIRQSDIVNATVSALTTAFAKYSLDEVCQITLSSPDTVVETNSTQSLRSILVSALSRALNELVDDDRELLVQSLSALSSPVSDPLALLDKTSLEALDIVNALVAGISRVGLGVSETTAPETVVSTLSNLLASALFSGEDNTEQNGTSSRVGRRQLLSHDGKSASSLLLETVDTLAQSQRHNLVANEDAVGASAVNIRTASQLVSGDVGELMQEVTIDEMNASIAFVSSSGYDYATSLTEFSVNPHHREANGADATSNVIRLEFNVSAGFDEIDQDFGSTVASVSVSIPGLDSGVASREMYNSSELNVSVECPCGYEGVVKAQCPDNTTRSLQCTGQNAGVHLLSCNSTRSVCSLWNTDVGAWIVPDTCTAVFDGTMTRCECLVDSTGTASDYSTTDEVTDAVQRYVDTFSTKPDWETSRLVIYSFGGLFVLIVSYALIGRRLDRLSAQRIARGTSLDSQTQQERSIGRTDTEHISTVASEQTRIFVQNRTLRHLRDLVIHQHPVLNIAFVYSEAVPRSFRAWRLGIELLIFFLTLGFEASLEYPEADCSKYDRKESCEKEKSLGSRNKLCTWDLCAGACRRNEPGDGVSSQADHFVMVALVIMICIPIIYVVDYLFINFIIATPPEGLECICRLLGVGSSNGKSSERFAKSSRSTLLEEEEDEGIGRPPNAEDDENAIHIAGDVDVSSIDVDETALVTQDERDAREHRDTSVDHDNHNHDALRLDESYCNVVEEAVAAKSTDTVAIHSLPARKDIYRDDDVDEDGDVCKVIKGSTFTKMSRSLMSSSSPTDQASDGSTVNGSPLRGSFEKSSRFKDANATVYGVARSARRKVYRAAITKKHKLSSFGGRAERQVRLQEAQKLAPHIADLVLRRRAELLACIRIAEERKDMKGHRAVYMLRDLEKQLLKQWEYLPNRSLWLANIRTITRRQMKAAVELKMQLDSTIGSTPEETATLRTQMLIEYQRVAKLSAPERKVYQRAKDRVDFTFEATVESPSALQYVCAWLALLVLIAGTFVYLVVVASSLGKGKSKMWLASVFITIALYYLILKPAEILFFDAFLPSLLATRMEKMQDPTQLKAFPYQTPLPHSSLYYLCVIDHDVRNTRVGRYEMGELSTRSVDVFEQLDQIYDDRVEVALGTRFSLRMVAYFLVLPAFLQEILFEEALLLLPLFTKFAGHFMDLPPFLDSTQNRRGNFSEFILMLGVVILLSIIIVVGFLVNSTLNQGHRVTSALIRSGPSQSSI